MATEQTKEEVTEKLICMLIDSIGWITREEVLIDANLATELHIDGDDLSFFIEEVEDYFDMRLTQNEWGSIGSLRQTADLVMQYRGMKLQPPLRRHVRSGEKMTTAKTKEETTEEVLAIFIACVGWIKREDIKLDVHMITGLGVYDGDIMAFICEVEKEFDMRLTQNEWGQVSSLQDTIDLVMQYRGMKLRPPPEPGLWAWLRRWIF